MNTAIRLKQTISLPDRRREFYDISMYTDANGEHRWRMLDNRNNKIIDASTEGFVQVTTCVVNCFLSTGFVPDGWTLQ